MKIPHLIFHYAGHKQRESPPLFGLSILQIKPWNYHWFTGNKLVFSIFDYRMLYCWSKQVKTGFPSYSSVSHNISATYYLKLYWYLSWHQNSFDLGGVGLLLCPRFHHIPLMFNWTGIWGIWRLFMMFFEPFLNGMCSVGGAFYPSGGCWCHLAF